MSIKTEEQALAGARDELERDGQGEGAFKAPFCLRLGDILYHLERYSEAERLYLRAMDLMELERGPADQEVAEGWFGLARTLEAQGKTAQAERAYREGLMVLRATGCRWEPSMAAPLHALADLYAQVGRPQYAAQFHHLADALADVRKTG